MDDLSRRRTLGLMTAAATVPLLARPGRAQVNGIEVVAPSSPGSGYDQLARSMQTALTQEKLATGIEVKNVPGGGGTVGLAQYLTSRARGPSVMVLGFALVGGVLTTNSPVSLASLTPVARLMAEPDIIVVRSDSPIGTVADLVTRLKGELAQVRWAGGSIGGIDHVLAGLVTRAAGADPAKMNFIVHAGGGEVMASLLSGRTTAGLSGYEEMRSQIDAGLLRPLAISSAERMPGLDIPTLKEGGVDVTLMNWRGLMTKAGTTPADLAPLSEMVAAMVRSPSWKEVLKSRGWLDFYQPSAEFGAFLKEEQTRVETVLKSIGLVK